MNAKRILSLFMAVLIMVSAAGCSKGNQADTDTVRAAVDKLRACESVSVVQHTQQEETLIMDNEKMVCDVDIQMHMSIISQPVPQMMTATDVVMDYEGEHMTQRSASYIVPENGGYTEYTTAGTEWYKIVSENADALAGLNAGIVADSFYTDSIQFGKVCEESIDGVKATRYDGNLGGEALVAMMNSSGLLSSIASMSENQQAVIRKNLVKDLDDVTVSVWIDEASGYPVRFEVSMTELLKDMDASIAKSLGNKSSDTQYSITGCVISMVASDFNAVEEIVVPEEALSATLYTGE